MLAVTLCAAACSNVALPSSPSATMSPASSLAGASGGIASTSALADSILAGSAYQITAVNLGDGTISGTNAQGAFTAPFDSGTTFRRAQIDRFFPQDPLYEAVVAYNEAGVGGLGDTFYGTLSALEGGNARIIVQFDNGVPPNPIRILSFQPIP